MYQNGISISQIFIVLHFLMSVSEMRGAEAPLGFSVRGIPECFGSSRLSCEAHAVHGTTPSRVPQMESVDGENRLDLPM